MTTHRKGVHPRNLPRPVEQREEAVRRMAAGQSPVMVGRDMGIPRATVYQWRLDPAGESNRRRKRERYSRPCVDCGAATDGSGGFKRQRKRCNDCAGKHRHEHRVWTPDVIVEAIQAWERQYGFVPSASDWNTAQAKRRTDAALRLGRFRTGNWPSTTVVQHECGSWNAAIRAAGFEPTQRSHYGRPGEDLDSLVVRRAVESYQEGDSGPTIARRLGVSATTVYDWLRRSGVQIRSTQREAA